MRASEFLFPTRQTLLDQGVAVSKQRTKPLKRIKPRKLIKPSKPQPTQVLAAPPKSSAPSRASRGTAG